LHLHVSGNQSVDSLGIEYLQATGSMEGGIGVLLTVMEILISVHFQYHFKLTVVNATAMNA
jgi:hypothetical protein